MKTIISEGRSPELAFNNQANYILDVNATKAFHKTNEDIAVFAAQFLEDRYGSTEGIGAYIVLQAPKAIPTKIKYKVDNIINKTSRKWETVTNFIDEDNNILQQIPTKGTTKAQAITIAKSLATEGGKTVNIVLSKRVKVGNPTTAVVSVAPQHTDGKYYFFGTENITLPKEDE